MRPPIRHAAHPSVEFVRLRPTQSTLAIAGGARTATARRARLRDRWRMTPTASVFGAVAHAYDTAIVDTGRQPQFLLLVAFLLTFGFIRTSAHLIRAQVRWWPGNVDVGGTHIHHLVWGILLLLTLGYAAIAFAPGSPWRELLAGGFGIGMGLTLDEFALWLDLRDVYWLPDGRKSIDAVIVAATAGSALLLGVRVWIGVAGDIEAAVKLVVTSSVAFGVLLAILNALRGRLIAAAVSLALPPAGLVLLVALRPRPRSIWERVLVHRHTPAKGEPAAEATPRRA
jgi:hypothetical protein